ncbi:81a99004-89bc-4a19-b6c3-ab167c5a1e80 [Thermothielavioides terrestris]|uniref:Peptidase A1 domain-containing protein n=2 Tax=Thermothielavioides terrestris TaxID=2587410 RepID=G2R0S9_THETT|nr:uncharacterized protein THITE_65985 [Thermothielavioides terrestris NRRL 8126]AEO67340.1 hypothetical protein THITE_65985 [Thermothielavioides terrestris NRRL 8126]SPQ24050.1 81a99004-89bc-4a19-b6c3-ab167c5a1e80 [Thermothielavioides terrestris]
MSASPSGAQKRSFTVKRLRNPAFQRHNWPRELLRTYQKYRMPIPQELLSFVGDQTGEGLLSGASTGGGGKLEQPSRADVSGVGLVAATPVNEDAEYVSPIKVGGQTINVALDSGSADLWVFSSRLPASDLVGHQAYNSSQSSSFRSLPGANFSILYADATSASGDVGTDTVDVGGATVTSQAVGMATSVSSAFAEDTNLSGLLGLAFSQLSTIKPTKQKTFFENVMPSLAEPVFTADLRKDAAGAFEFGRIDGSKFVGALSWAPVNTSSGFWQVSTRGFAVGNTQTSLPAADAIVDTGTTIMLVSEEISDGYYSQVPGAQLTPAAAGMTFPCNATLPDLLVDVDGVYTARVKGTDINFGPLNSTECFGGIQRTTNKLQVWGDVFIRSQFVVFHGGNQSLGLAPHV